ncbi:MAG: D-mannonate epimerase [Planctomycetota bacterium]|nr:MAG: D-mannonate epimerase [Planctomycetota bacterium]
MISYGGVDTVIDDQQLCALLVEACEKLGPQQRVLAVPPDFTRADSRAGLLTTAAHQYYGAALCDILPALGTHDPMPAWQLDRMFPGIPHDLFRVHDWRNDVVTVGTIESETVSAATEGVWDRPWPAQLNQLVAHGGHDLILSIGQVVPHEVVGMANHAKNLFVGTGGKDGINESHFIGAAYGMERMMGRADTPTRRLLTLASDRFLGDRLVLWVLTVVGPAKEGEQGDHHGLVTRGVYIGTGIDCFEQACALAQLVNFQQLDEELDTVVVYLDPEEFHSTWLGNKSVYRTRMAIADGGELIVLAPGLETFGEDKAIDALIRKYGYRTTPEIMAALENNVDLGENLSAAAHLIHGSSEGRFTVRYCPGPGLSREEIEGVGYAWGDLEDYRQRYDPTQLRPGFNSCQGQRVFYIPNPALGLWAYRGRFAESNTQS